MGGTKLPITKDISTETTINYPEEMICRHSFKHCSTLTVLVGTESEITNCGRQNNRPHPTPQNLCAAEED